MYFKGQGNKKAFELRQDQTDYLTNFNKDNPLFENGLNLLSLDDIRPYHLDPQAQASPDFAKEMKDSSLGYTYPWGDDKNLYIRDIETLNDPIIPINYNENKQFPMQFGGKGGIPGGKEDFYHQKYWNDYLNEDMANTVTHEGIHQKLWKAYPNAIKEMLRGTSELGQADDWGGTLAFGNQYDWYPTGKPHPGFETYEAFDGAFPSFIDDHPMWVESETEGWGPSGPSPAYQQDELLTQQLTNLIHGGSYLNPSDFIFAHMDRPGQKALSWQGPDRNADGLTWDEWSETVFDDRGNWIGNDDDWFDSVSQKTGLQTFLDKVSAPFYEQILSDAEKGYVQDSIWSTAAYGQKPGGSPDASRVHDEPYWHDNQW